MRLAHRSARDFSLILVAICCLAGPSAAQDMFPQFSDEPAPKKARPAAKSPLTSVSPDTQRILVLLDKIGVKSQIDDLPADIKEVLALGASQNQKIGKHSWSAFAPAVDRAYEPQRVLSDIAIQMAKTLPGADQQNAEGFAQSSVGKRLTEIDIRMASPEGFDAYMEFVNNANAHRASWGPHIEMYQELDAAMQYTHRIALINTNASFALLKGLDSAGILNAADKKRTNEAFDATLTKRQKEFANVSLLTFAYIGLTVSEPEMREWLAFASSPSGKTFYRNINSSVELALTSAAARYGRAQAAIIKGSQ